MGSEMCIRDRCKTCKKLSDHTSTKPYKIHDMTVFFCVSCSTQTMEIITINSKHNDIMRIIQTILPNARFSLHDTDLDKITIQLNPSELGIQD